MNNSIEVQAGIGRLISIIKETGVVQIEKSGNDLIIRWPEWGSLVVRLEMKKSAYPELIRDTCRRLNEDQGDRENHYSMIVAPFISAESGEICRKYGVGFIDYSGNILFKKPPLAIDIRAGNRFPIDKKLKSIYSGRAAWVIHTLLNHPGKKWNGKELAKVAGVSEATVFLVKENLIENNLMANPGVRQSFSINHESRIIEEVLSSLVNEYDFLKTHRFTYFFAEESPEQLEKKWARILEENKIPYALTSTSAQRILVDHIRYSTAHIYIGDWEKFQSLIQGKLVEYGLSESESGGEVAFVKPVDNGVFLGLQMVKGFRVVSNVQAYLDLIKYPARGKEAADFIKQAIVFPIKDHWDGEKNGKRIEDLTPLKELFWEADVSSIDIDLRKKYIIERILEYGNKPEFQWMMARYTINEIKEVLQNSRVLSEKSVSFWREVLL